MTPAEHDALGGFQSGFYARKVPREQCRWPQYLICGHHCQEIIQLISRVSQQVEFEMCAIEAKRFAAVLLAAANGETLSADDINRD